MHTKINLNKELAAEIHEVCGQTWLNTLSAKVAYLIRSGIRTERSVRASPEAANSNEDKAASVRVSDKG